LTASFKKSNLFSYFRVKREGFAIEIIQIIGVAFVSTFLALIVKEQKPNFAFLLIVFVGCAIFLFLVDQIYEIIHMIEKIAVNAKVNLIYVETILKIIGIAYIAEFASQITKDAGQGAIASKIELGAKIMILTMAIPILTLLIETIIKLIPS
jgi:stage III sporulation protein AD